MQTQTVRTQKGVYLVIVSVLMVVLIAFGALSLDLGRLFVLRTEMQNAADAAAMAAARELGGETGAIARATAAARFTVEHEGRFADDQELLRTNITIDYFCAIGSRFDPDASIVGNFCTGSQDAEGRYETSLDAEAKYVRVSLIPSEDDNTYSLQLMFLPVLSLFLDDVDTSTSIQASAIAGRSFFQCDYPPVMMCNPFEPDAFRDAMAVGEQIRLRKQGGAGWAPGNFAFLQNGPSGGAEEAGVYMADAQLTGCNEPILITEPGQMTNQTINGMNTRFDMYSNPGFGGASAEYPPAPNVIDFPRDQNWRPSPNERFGLGDWDRDTYFTDYHDWQGHGRPGDWANLTRYAVYLWEIDENKLPSLDPLSDTDDTTYDGIPDPNHLYTGDYPPPQSIPERRVMNAAVVNCTAQGIDGRSTFAVFGNEGFARMFLTEKANETGNPGFGSVWVEYLGWSSVGTDGNQYIDVQLYE